MALVVLVDLLPSRAHAEVKMALLIANQKYNTTVGVLKNPGNDIALVGSALKKIGFSDVKLANDLKRSAILGAVREFATRLKKAGPGAIGFFYYSGHGAAEGNTRINYLIPVDAPNPDSSAFWDEALKLDDVLQVLEGAREATKIVIFDACRNELNLPHRGTEKGFSPVAEQPGMFIAYSTAPGRPAYDNGAKSGPYAGALAQELLKTGIHHLDLFQNIKENVISNTGGKQEPWELNGLRRRVYLHGMPSGPESPSGNNPGTGVPRSRCSGVELSVEGEQKCIQFLDTFSDCSSCPRLVMLPGGTYTIGSPTSELGRDTDEEPLMDVTVRPFAIGQYEITRNEWSKCVDSGACGRKLDPPQILTTDLPANLISWQDAKEYVRWLSSMTNARYRLPSESEWEYAARSGIRGPRFWGFAHTDACQYANVGDKSLALATADVPLTQEQVQRRRLEHGGVHDCNDGFAGIAPIGRFKANHFGLHDMLGNLWEWVEDCAFPNYKPLPRTGEPYTEADCKVGNLRGGSYLSGPASVRSANRFQGGRNRSYAQPDFGFRVARDINP
jgi:formylglycine-generating enzyme required for sulfatase activity